ncbi:hypothetical protein [Syntrophomonas curvata]
MANKLLNFIVISLLFIFVTLTKLSGLRFRFSIYYLIVLPVAYLWCKFTKQANNLGKWYINKTVLLIFSPFIIIVTAYSYAVTEGSNLKIVLIATLTSILLSMLFSLYKEKDGDFKVTLTLIKSLSNNDLTQVLNTLEESEQKLIIQRFGLENGKPLTIAVLSDYYSMDTTELKNWLSLVDNKLFESIKSKRTE